MVRIIADTTSAIRPEVARELGIPIIPQIINFGNESFIERRTIDNAEFLDRLKKCRELPKTAAPAPEWFVEEFRRIVPTGEPIICIHPSAEVSGTVRSAQVAAKDFPGADIRIIDTRLVSSPLSTLVELAGKWAKEGLDADTIESRVREMAPRCRLYAVVATLEFLAKGGRIGGASALLGTVLQIKPILTFKDGRLETFGKERTQKQAVARIKELVLQQIPRDREGYLSIMHAAVQQQAEDLANDLKQKLGLKEVPIYDVPPAITTHSGPGLLGVAFFQ